MTIRPITPADLPRIAELTTALGYPVTEADLAPRLESLNLQANQFLRVAAAATGDVVGWIHVTDEMTLESGRRAEILGLVVDEQFRGKGVGRALVEEAERWARARGIEQMMVRSNVIRPESHRFYEALDYRRTKTQHVYRKELG